MLVQLLDETWTCRQLYDLPGAEDNSIADQLTVATGSTGRRKPSTKTSRKKVIKYISKVQIFFTFLILFCTQYVCSILEVL